MSDPVVSRSSVPAAAPSVRPGFDHSGGAVVAIGFGVGFILAALALLLQAADIGIVRWDVVAPAVVVLVGVAVLVAGLRAPRRDGRGGRP